MKLLQTPPVAAIDLNLGCPAPIVYRKCAGGGLLREPARIDAAQQRIDALDLFPPSHPLEAVAVLSRDGRAR